MWFPSRNWKEHADNREESLAPSCNKFWVTVVGKRVVILSKCTFLQKILKNVHITLASRMLILSGMSHYHENLHTHQWFSPNIAQSKQHQYQMMQQTGSVLDLRVMPSGICLLLSDTLTLSHERSRGDFFFFLQAVLVGDKHPHLLPALLLQIPQS